MTLIWMMFVLVHNRPNSRSYRSVNINHRDGTGAKFLGTGPFFFIIYHVTYICLCWIWDIQLFLYLTEVMCIIPVSEYYCFFFLFFVFLKGGHFVLVRKKDGANRCCVDYWKFDQWISFWIKYYLARNKHLYACGQQNKLRYVYVMNYRVFLPETNLNR